MRIIFMGTPDFAVYSLDILHTAGYDIVAVITSPDKYGGRGRKTLIESDVKKYAVSKNLDILQPKNLKSPKFLDELRSYEADLQIVVAFRMLPEVVWNMPPLGTYNLHGSLLPKYRGAAPINWAVIKGESTTGVTSFKLKHEIDTGSICLQKEIPIYLSDTAGTLHDRMKYVAADVVLETVRLIEKEEIKLIPQDNRLVSHAPKLNPENTELTLNITTQEAIQFIRGLNPFPGAWFNLGDKKVKIYEAIKSELTSQHASGTLISDNKSHLSIACQNGNIDILELQYPGKKRMKITDFLNGFDMTPYAFMIVEK